MKSNSQSHLKPFHCLAVVALFLAMALPAQAQVYSENVIGFISYPFSPGENLFANPLQQQNGDTLSEIFTEPPPDGTTISLWNPATASFSTGSVFDLGSWSVDLTLQPGTGYELYAPAAFANIFVGNVLNCDGSSFGGVTIIPPPFSDPHGTYLLADACPITDTGVNVFLDILGRLPNLGEKVTTLDASTQTYITSTYLGNDTWTTVPTLNPGDAAFFDTGFYATSVPEPSTTAFGFLGFLAVAYRSRRYFGLQSQRD
jgi:hypothetical protein